MAKFDDPLIPIRSGEDSTRQFKADFKNAESLAAEMAAFANSEGGTIFIGVNDRGQTVGLPLEDVGRMNQLIGNSASHGVRSPLTVLTQNVSLPDGRVVILLKVPKGTDKPYFDKNGVIWLRVGADKRRVNSKEELRRFFQVSDQFHADELPTRAGIDALDKLRFRDFLRDRYDQEFPDAAQARLTLLQNMNLATDEGVLNLAGLLLFGEQPERLKPQFVVKAVSYPSDRIDVASYEDAEDFAGPLAKVFDGALGFVLRNLHKVQAGRGVNSLGIPEVPIVVFEELLVNALVHRDYLIDAPIRLFVFRDRVEIISPGHLPNHLTVEKIRVGNSILRNPILASFVAKGLLPYRGLGSGVPRAIESWPRIDFRDDRDGNLFVATVQRELVAPEKSAEFGENADPSGQGSEKSSEKGSEKSAEFGENTDYPGESSEKGSEKSAEFGENTDPSGESSEKSSEKGSEKSAEFGENADPSGESSEKSSEKGSEKSAEFGENTDHSGQGSEKSSEKILEMLETESGATISRIALTLGLSRRAIEKQLASLKASGRLRRIGPDKGGRWEVIR